MASLPSNTIAGAANGTGNGNGAVGRNDAASFARGMPVIGAASAPAAGGQVGQEGTLDAAWVQETLEAGWRHDNWTQRAPDNIFREPRAVYQHEEEGLFFSPQETVELGGAWSAASNANAANGSSSSGSNSISDFRGFFQEIQCPFRVDGAELIFFPLNSQSLLWRTPSGKNITTAEIVRSPLWISGGAAGTAPTAAAGAAGQGGAAQATTTASSSLLLVVGCGHEVSVFSLSVQQEQQRSALGLTTSNAPLTTNIFIEPTPYTASAEPDTRFTVVAGDCRTRRVFLGDASGGLWDLVMKSASEGKALFDSTLMTT